MGGDEEQVARLLVRDLDARELQLLDCIVQGMALKDAALLQKWTAVDAGRVRAAMMMKLSAVTTADAVRIGLSAGIGRLD